MILCTMTECLDCDLIEHNWELCAEQGKSLENLKETYHSRNSTDRSYIYCILKLSLCCQRELLWAAKVIIKSKRNLLEMIQMLHVTAHAQINFISKSHGR